MLQKISIKEFTNKTKDQIKEQTALIIKSKSIIFYPIFLLYTITIIGLAKCTQLLFNL